MRTKPNTVSLNGVEYFVRGPVIAQPVSDFAANVRIGEPSYETRQGAGYAVFEDFSGGPGVIDGLTRQDLARFADTTGVDTRIPRQATSPLAATAASDHPDAPDGTLTNAERLRARRSNRMMGHIDTAPLIAGGVYDYLVYGHGIHRNQPSAWDTEWTTIDSGLDCIFDACKYTPQTGSLAGTEWLIAVGKDGWRRTDLDVRGAQETTFAVPLTGDDGYILHQDNESYAECRLDPGDGNLDTETANTNETTFRIGQEYTHAGTTWRIDRGYLRFNTASIPDAAIISTAKVRIHVSLDDSDTNFTVLAKKYTWSGGGLTTADWRTDAEIATDTTLGTSASTSTLSEELFIPQWFEIPLDDPDTDIVKDGYTEMYLVSSRDVAGTDPKPNGADGDEFITIHSIDYNSGSMVAELVVDYHASPTDSAAKKTITCLNWADKLLIQMGEADAGAVAGDVVVSLDADTFVTDSGGSNYDIIWHLPLGTFLGPAAAPWGEMAPYFFTETDLYVLNFWERASYKVPIGLHTIKCATTWSEGIVISDGYNIVQYIPGVPGTVRHIGLPKEQGFIETSGWSVDCLYGVDGGYLYALLRLDAGTDFVWLWEYRGATWHPLGMPQTTGGNNAYGIGLLVTDRSLGAGTGAAPQRGYWLVASDLVAYSSEVVKAWKIADPSGDANPLIGTAAFDTTLTRLTTPWMDCGFKELPGVALQLEHGGVATANETIIVHYDIGAGVVELGTFNNTVSRLDFGTADSDSGNHPGIAFTTIRFRFGLTATASATPNLLPLTFVFRKKPPLRMSYLFTIDAAQELVSCAEDGTSKEFAALFAELVTAWNSSTLVRFYYPVRTEAGAAVASGNLEVDKRIDIVSMPTREVEIRDAKRKGAIVVQVMEPASWA